MINKSTTLINFSKAIPVLAFVFSFQMVDGTAFHLNKEKNQGIPYDIKNTTSEPLYQTMLEGCTTYKVDVLKGKYTIHLFFTEPQIKPSSELYSLKASGEKKDKKNRRIFDIYLNGELLQANVDMAHEYPEK